MTRIYLSSPHMGNMEAQYVQEAFATNWIAPVGPHVSAFEQEFAALTHCGHAAALSSGTAALHLALVMSGVGPGDEVVCSTLTFVASVNPIKLVGATPVFVDSDTKSWNMDPLLLAELLAQKAAIGRLPKAVVVVHLYGQSADLDPIMAVCQTYGIDLIEDAAEVLGAYYFSDSPVGESSSAPALTLPEPITIPAGKHAVAPGTMGRTGIYSFNGNKIITTSGGGMLVSHDARLAEQARFLATQARDDAPHYEHSQMGFNYRLSNVLAGIGRGQLQVLSARVESRRRNFAHYVESLGDLPGIAFMPEADYCYSNRWLSCITVDPKMSGGVTREHVRETLAVADVEARPVWKPMHQQPLYAGAQCIGGSVADWLFDHGLCLPSGSNLTLAQLERVSALVRAAWTTPKQK